MEFLINGHWFEVLPEDYVFDFGYGSGDCTLCISPKDITYWLMGDVFMRGWYSVHDLDQKRIGFVPYKGSNKSVPILADSYPKELLPVLTADLILGMT